MYHRYRKYPGNVFVAVHGAGQNADGEKSVTPLFKEALAMWVALDAVVDRLLQKLLLVLLLHALVVAKMVGGPIKSVRPQSSGKDVPIVAAR